MLSEAFASCQFIVTTHSAQVLSGVESKQVRIVEVDENDGSSKATWRRGDASGAAQFDDQAVVRVWRLPSSGCDAYRRPLLRPRKL